MMTKRDLLRFALLLTLFTIPLLCFSLASNVSAQKLRPVGGYVYMCVRPEGCNTAVGRYRKGEMTTVKPKPLTGWVRVNTDPPEPTPPSKPIEHSCFWCNIWPW